MRLPRASRHISVPVIIPTVGVRAPPRRTNKIIKAYPPKLRKKNLDEVFTGPKEKLRVNVDSLLIEIYFISSCYLLGIFTEL